MKKEQEEMVQAFKSTYSHKIEKPIAIYGTGINAEAVITCCKECPIIGVVDVAKTGEIFCGLPVLSLDELVERNIREIVVVARPSVHVIIYKRIQKWCEDNGITVLDIYGNDIAGKLQERIYEHPYFRVSYEDLKREIDCHEAISFDVFDTLLMRRVYEPADVFILLDRELSGRFPFIFSRERMAAEQELGKECEPTIYQIYEYLAEKHHLSEEEKQYLLLSELDKEKDVLCVRERMKLCMEYCIRQGKAVYLVSDMYLPEELLGELLGKFGITGYRELLVSCDYQTSKPERLFEILKKRLDGKSCLHVGDNQEADFKAAKRHGLDAFLVMPAIRMMELSAYGDVFVHLNSVSSRVMLGMLAAEIFQDPFALSGTKGLPVITNAGRFGYALIAPLVLSFIVWLFHKLNRKRDSLLLFSARDGWLIQKVFHQLASAWNLTELPEDVYFMVSRKALEIVEKEVDKQAEGAYLDYLKSLELSKYDIVFYFDFMSRGTCQSLLEHISGQQLQGVYFQKSVSGVASKDAIQVWRYFEEGSAHDRDLRIFALCDFLECILTSYNPSFEKFDMDGSCIFETEKRTEEQIETLREIHSGIFRYCSDFARIWRELPEEMPPKEYCDGILRYTSSEYSRILVPELKEFMLDDWLGGDKNTGMDALI